MAVHPVDQSLQSLCVVVAGGQSQRMGEDKFRLPFLNGTLLEYIVDRLRAQTPHIALNINQNFDSDLPVFADSRAGLEGPLSGILSAMIYAESQGFNHVVTVACDTPFIPNDFILKISHHSDVISLASSLERDHPLMSHWPVRLKDDLSDFLEAGNRKVMKFIEGYKCEKILWDGHPIDPFFNINTAGDLKQALTWAEK